MNKKELKKAKKNAKELIKNNDNFIVLTQDDIIGCSSLSEIWLMLVVGLRNIKRDLMTKTLMQEMCNLVMCDNMDEYLEKNGKKITEELEKTK
jgi:hypothetical protein